MKRILIILICSFAIIFIGCQKLIEDDVESTNSQKTKLNVVTRTSEDVIIEYPLYLFAFDEDGNLKASQKLNSQENSMSLELSQGKYSIVALSGVGDEYKLPNNPTYSSIISLENACSYSKALMMGEGKITLQDKNASLDVTLSYAVASIYVYLDHISSSAKNVTFTISSLFSCLSLNNVYSNSNNEITIDCKLGTDGKWIAGPIYVFPSSNDNSVISIIIKESDQTKTYSYKYNGKILAGTPFIINGNYKNGIMLGGKILTSGWKDKIEFAFDFGENSNDDKPSNIPNNDVPKICTLWNGCIVADVGETENGVTNLLLLSTKAWDSTIAGAEELVKSYKVNDIEGWKIPSYEEATFLRKFYNGDKLAAINDLLESVGENKIYDDTDSRFLCYSKEGEFCSFRFSLNSKIVKVTNSDKSYFLRAVKNYSYSNK